MGGKSHGEKGYKFSIKNSTWTELPSMSESRRLPGTIYSWIYLSSNNSWALSWLKILPATKTYSVNDNGSGSDEDDGDRWWWRVMIMVMTQDGEGGGITKDANEKCFFKYHQLLLSRWRNVQSKNFVILHALILYIIRCSLHREQAIRSRWLWRKRSSILCRMLQH